MTKAEYYREWAEETLRNLGIEEDIDPALMEDLIEQAVGYDTEWEAYSDPPAKRVTEENEAKLHESIWEELDKAIQVALRNESVWFDPR